MADTQTFDPAQHGFRVADEPIKRKQRTPSTKPVPKPKYADSVYWSFDNGRPLEAVVPTRSVEDTVRALKRAARYLERTHKVEVRVQVGVEPVLDEDGQPVKPAKSTVKFLGHAPWLLGRRIGKESAMVEPDVPEPTPAPAAPRHRRTTAATRGQHAKASLHRPMVRAVITRPRPPHPVANRDVGALVFLPRFRSIKDTSFPSLPPLS